MDTKSYRTIPLSDMQITDSTELTSKSCPFPSDLKEYLPYACNQLGINCSVIVQVERDTSKTDKQKKQPQTMNQSIPNYHLNLSASQAIELEEQHESGVVVTATYDSQDNLTQLQIGGPFKKPRSLYQILSYILSYYPCLSSIKVLPPIDKYSAYEIGKMLHMSRISDITLDGCFVSEANFYLLLEGNINLKRLSLARCSITDCVLQEITQKLVYPTQASKCLSILILSSNQITNEGAQHISKMLRSNTNLCYLNLADNSITDDGATSILNALMEFEITEDELKGYRARYTEYLLKKLNTLIKVPGTQLTSHENTEVVKGQKPKAKLRKAQLSKTQALLVKQATSLEKKNPKVEFTDPFHDWHFVDGKIYSKGNHYLHCLNLSYNRLSLITVKKIVQVLSYQRALNGKPRGIVNIRLEGNLMPKFCLEYEQIDDFINDAVEWQTSPMEGSARKMKK